ncbi:MAG: LacI family DNA-binding transcriptional regulator [Eubacterium sp.]|nr:LacI family DNA-binding transcriptional regulator [Eubacterium sp.]
MAVTIKEIADACGVSRGTVDRALHNRGRVQPEVAERIRKVADEMGYTINVSGRALAMTGKNITIGVVLQFAETPFMQKVREGILEAESEISQFGCRVDLCEIRGIDMDQTVRQMEILREKKVQSIAVVAGEDRALREEINKCMDDGIGVITLNSDLADSGRKCFVGQNAETSGRMAAGLMGDLLRGSGRVLLFYGIAETSQGARVRGFRDVIERDYPGITVTASCKTENNPKKLAEQLRGILQKEQRPDGIYLCAEGAPELAGCLRESGSTSEIRVITHDLAGCNPNDIADRTIDYVIDDDGHRQGYLAVRLLFWWFYHQKEPQDVFYATDIRVISKYNMHWEEFVKMQ